MLAYLETLGEGDAVAGVDVVEGVVGMMSMDMEHTGILEDTEEAILEDMEEGMLAHMAEDTLDHPDTRDNMAAAVVEDATEAMAWAPTITTPAPTSTTPNIPAVRLALTASSMCSTILPIRARGE